MVTDRRIIRVSGLLNTTVDAVVLSQITDTTYHRSLIGRILDYGTLGIESAGQRQSLERLDFIPTPGAIYRATLAHLDLPRDEPGEFDVAAVLTADGAVRRRPTL
jgi:hypothetical protein